MTSVTNARGDVESYGYNSNDWRTSVTNGRSFVRNYTFTSRGEVYTLTMPDSSVETWSYNANGDTSAYTNQLSQAINYTYDDASRQTGIVYPSGTGTSFGYDTSNRRTSMVDSTGTTTWTYNNGSEVTALSTPEGSLSYTYQTSGRRATMVETGLGTTTYGYDVAGHMTSLQNPFSETTSFTFDDAGRMSRKTFASGAYTAFGYDGRNRTTSIDHKKSDNSAISSESYSYDSASNLTSKTIDSVTTTYTYDNIDQLLSESTSGYSASYTYDANGNRATKTLNGTMDTYITDSSDKLTSIGRGGTTIKSFGYDTAGRTTSVVTAAGTTTLAYDYEGRVIGITYPNSSTNSFSYNGLDTRVSKIDSLGTKAYKRDGANVDDPLLNDGIANYTTGISERRSGSTAFVHSDQLGSMRLLTNSSQSTTDTRRYDGFGMVLSASGSTITPFGFAGGRGYQGDNDSGLALLGHRYYDPSTARFLSRDVARDGRNWYSYCANNPIKFVDPRGLEAWEVLPVIKRAIANRKLVRGTDVEYKQNKGFKKAVDMEIGSEKISSNARKNPNLAEEEVVDIVKEKMPKALRKEQEIFEKEEEAARHGGSAPTKEDPSGFMEKMSAITGLTGTALIIYIIISEGSRAFPPRNLVPVP